MKVALFSYSAMAALKTIVGVVGIFLCCAFPAQAKTPLAFDQFNTPSDLVLTLPEPLLAEKQDSLSSDRNTVTNDQNIMQTSTVKSKPVNVNCGVDVIQNNLNNASINNRVYGECGLQYHY